MSQFQKLDSGGQGQIYAVNADTVYKSIKFSDHYKEISELCVLSALSHPNIVKIKRYELTRNDCKIYMERLHSNIYDFAKKCTFEKRLELFPQIFWAMVRVARFFQVNGIINCDIKSENVMVSKDWKTVKVIDFGHLICDENYPIIGTRSYQPPELWLEDKYNYKSMVWSIGISALEFLYRIHPIVDIVYGEEPEEEESESSTPPAKKKKSESFSSKSGSYTDDTEEEDDFRERYTNLFEILTEEGASLPFRHRLDQQMDRKIRDRLSSINSVLERMLTYDMSKRISLEELYKHRIFEKIRGNVQEEAVMTVAREPLFIDKDLTLVFLSFARKIYRDEIVIHAYTLLSTYLEKVKGGTKDRHEFMVTCFACLDIMSYVFSMVPSTRHVHRKIILKMRSITEYMILDKLIDILKAVQCKVFLKTPVERLKETESNLIFPLLMELIESDAESGKKRLTSQSLVERYMSDDFMSDKEYTSEESGSDESEESEEESEPKAAKAAPHPKRDTDQKGVSKKDDQKEDMKGKEEKGTERREEEVIDEDDMDEDFLESFKQRVQQAYQQEKLRKLEDSHENGDTLIIHL